MATAVIDSYKFKINSNGDIYIRVYFKPVTIMRKKISNWNIYKLQNIGIGSVISFEVKYSIAITITSITRAKNPIVIKTCPFCCFKIDGLRCDNGFCKGIVDEKLKILNLYWYMFDKDFHFGFNAFKQVDINKGKGYVKNKLLHTELCLICSIFDTYSEKYYKEYIYLIYIIYSLIYSKNSNNVIDYLK